MIDSKPPEPLNLNTADLHLTALSTLSIPPQPPPNYPITCHPASLPHSKLIPKTRFIVDGFKYADPNFSVSYFLSHFHPDHYTGLSPQWSKGIIYCSSITANLLDKILKIPQPLIFPLPLSQPVLIDGSEAWLVDANHCPGSVQFLFKVPVDNDNSSGTCRFEKYVHTGDFRYCNEMKNEIAISDFIGADALFLDTTYCNLKFVFPSQDESIDYIVRVIEKVDVKNVLFLVATYVVGKEMILMEVSRRCNRKIVVSSKKMNILHALGLGEDGVFTEDESESDIHVVGWNVLGETWPYFRPNFAKMNEIMSERGYSKIVGFVPTGCTYEEKQNKFAVRKKDLFEIHLVPFSEHSNYEELREYVRFMKPKRVVPTVGVDVEKINSENDDKMCKHFAGLVDEMAVKQEFLMGFLLGGVGANCCSDIEQEPVSRDSDDLEKSVQELQYCLPNWVTLSQMLELLKIFDGDIIEAVSNFYEHETEFHEQVAPTTYISCTSKESSGNQRPLAFEIQSSNSISRPENVSLSPSFKLSGSGNLKTSGKSPQKRKPSFGSKAAKKAKVKSTCSKQYSITKFFNKKMPVAVEDSKSEVKLNDSCGDQSGFATEAVRLYSDEVNHFIQIVDGGESLRSYAATILEKNKGDINMALDTYYKNNK